MVEEEIANGGSFTRQELQDILYSNRQHAGELTRDDVVAMCRRFPAGTAPSSSGPVSVGNSCDVLAAWDVKDGLDSRGALLFRRFWTRASGAAAGLWETPFDAKDPVNTPRDLNTEHPQVMQAYGDALNDLKGAGIPVDAPLGDFQKDERPDGTVTPYHGGPGGLGVFNAMAASWNAKKGYVGPLAHGASFIQAVSFDGDGCPDAQTMLAYSQSTNPKSPHFADQTKLYSAGGWVKGVFCEADVKAGTLSTLRLKALR
jgi:acyl-homoserine-lactone acylase